MADGDLEFPTWEIGAWVAVDGGVSYVARTRAEDEVAEESPERSCCRLDHDVTA